MLSTAILAPRDLIRDTAAAQRMSLLFDQILIWPLDRVEVDADVMRTTKAEIDFLRERGLVRTFGLRVPQLFRIKREDGSEFDPLGQAAIEGDFMLPIDWVPISEGGPDFETNADRIVYRMAQQCKIGDEPIVSFANPTSLVRAELGIPDAIQVSLDSIPMPDGTMPWEDFLAFRNDSETKARLRAFRVWLRKISASSTSAKEIEDELLTLLHDYTAFMDIQKIKYERGVIHTLLTSAASVVAHLATLNFSQALLEVLSLRGHGLDLRAAELTAPGREIAYISRSRQFLRTKAFTPSV
jgi:hypothetical protein